MARAVRKKKWYRILATPDFKNLEIGETFCDDPAKAIGRRLKVSLSNLTGDMRKQNVYIVFRIKEIKGEQLNTEIVGYELLNSLVKRLVRKGKNKVDDSFLVEFKDKTKARIKPLVLTKRRTTKKVLADIRKKTKEIIVSYCSKNDFNSLINKMIMIRMQIELRNSLSKVYPVSNVEFRKVNKVFSKK